MGPVWREARGWFAGKVRELVLDVRTDAAGNDWALLPCDSDETVIIGGHRAEPRRSRIPKAVENQTRNYLRTTGWSLRQCKI